VKNIRQTSKSGLPNHFNTIIFHFTSIVRTAGCGDDSSLSSRHNDFNHYDNQNLLFACRIPANKHQTTNIKLNMSDEPSSPTLNDPRQPLRQEIKRLKDQYKTLEIDFNFYEESNGKLQKQVDKQKGDIEQKDRELSYLKEFIDKRTKEHDRTHDEVETLRRRSSVLEITVRAQGKELKTISETEKLLTDREAEVRQFTAELHEVKTDRDDKLAEVVGLEGDLERLHLALAAKDREIDSLHERIDIFERHIRITKDLAFDELDDCLYDFVEKVTAKESDVVESFTQTSKKEKRRSPIGGFNLADEFDALSDDEEYVSEDDEGSDTRSVLSNGSVQSRKRRAKQVLSMSALQSVEIHPSIKPTTTSTGTQMSPISPKTIKPLPQVASSETQTSPTKSPVKTQTASTETQTSPIASPVKVQSSSMATQTSPIASPVKAQFSSMATQTSRIASPTKAKTTSAGAQYTPIVSPIKAQNTGIGTPVEAHSSSMATQTSPIASPVKPQTINSGTQFSPIASPTKAQVTSTGTQYTPIASPVKVQSSSMETQTSPITSPIKARAINTGTQYTSIASPIKAQNTSTETQTTPIASPKTPIASPIEVQTTDTGVRFSPIASPVKPAAARFASNETQTSPVATSVHTSHTSSSRAQTSPISSPRRSIFEMINSFEMISSAVQTSPIVATLSKLTPGSTSHEAQKSPTAASPKHLAPEATESGIQTSPVTTSPKKPVSTTTDTGTQSSPVAAPAGTSAGETFYYRSTQHDIDDETQQQASSDSQATANSGVQPRRKGASLQLSDDQATSTSIQTTPNTASAPSSNMKILNIKRTRVPATDMTPTTLSHFKKVTAPQTIAASSTSPRVSTTPVIQRTAVAPTLWQQAYARWQLLFLCALTAFIGTSMSISVAEAPFAQANGYAPENKFCYACRRVPGQLWAVICATIDWGWYSIFGEWALGSGYQQPLSPG